MKETFTPTVIENIENILKNAFAKGRSILFEHEVYNILTEVGLKTPSHIVIRDEKDITNNTLSLFGNDRIVLKVISSDIIHKQKERGIKIIYKDLDFVKYSFRKMKNSLKKKGHLVNGILLVDFIDYSQELGNEILLGFRESEAFGPVISFSKGGSDAEHFAMNFSPPNLILAPINRKWAQALLESTKIQKKFISEGKTGYITKIIDAVMKFSILSSNFSNFFENKSGFVISEFEINPFIFDYDGKFIAIDGYARFSVKERDKINLKVMSKKTITPFFEPESIAIIGISSSDNLKPGNIIVKNLLNLKRNNIYCVNKRGGSIDISGQTLPLYKSIKDINSSITLAIITVPADTTIPIIQECASIGVKAIILISGGFSEVMKNHKLEEEILEITEHHNIRIIGPNCLGIVYADTDTSKGINTFFIPEKKFTINLERDHNVAILSQSGALGITEIHNLRNSISPKVIVSYGNQLDVDPCDLVYYFEDDPVVDVIACYIEGFKRGAGRKFFNISMKNTKPIIVYKAGRTDAGKKATQSHTASIAGEYAVAKAAMKQAGIVVADSMIDHGDFIKTFALLHDFNVTGDRVAIIANAGYEITCAADNLGNLVMAEFDKKTITELERILPSFVNADPLLDLTPMASDELFEQCIDIVLKSNSVDALFLSIVPQGIVINTTDEEIEQHKENIATKIIDIVHMYKKPTVLSVNVVSGADAVYNKFGQILDSGGVPTFLTAKRAMLCLNEFIHYKMTKKSNTFSEWLK